MGFMPKKANPGSGRIRFGGIQLELVRTWMNSSNHF